MGNLGWYQLLTTMAKKVGGPKKLIGLLVGGGALLGGGAVAGGSAIKKKVTSELKKKKKTEQAAVVHTVNTEGTSNEGLCFKAGDKFKVLDVDGDAGLIEIIGDNNSPYFVSLKFLSSISDYKID
ncbi:hypothetical protein [uncultured Ruminococcus sp.]|uniref:hypothetical protein n=1 Tax=uncultured Ruminococcus sp. TaxID=165186 RepID=UPI0025E60165|nr:hypothetical protein [uncultured Ruminococcus sp.]